MWIDYIKPWSDVYSSEAKIFGMYVHEKPNAFKYFLRSVGKRFDDAYYWFYYRFTAAGRSLWSVSMSTPGYYCEDELLLQLSFKILDDYIKNCLIKYQCDIAGLKKWSEEMASEEYHSQQGAHQLSHIEMWEWWTVKRPARHAAHDAELLRVFGDDHSDETVVLRAARDSYQREEESMNQEDEDMLVKLAKLRLSMWT